MRVFNRLQDHYPHVIAELEALSLDGLLFGMYGGKETVLPAMLGSTSSVEFAIGLCHERMQLAVARARQKEGTIRSNEVKETWQKLIKYLQDTVLSVVATVEVDIFKEDEMQGYVPIDSAATDERWGKRYDDL